MVTMFSFVLINDISGTLFTADQLLQLLDGSRLAKNDQGVVGLDF